MAFDPTRFLNRAVDYLDVFRLMNDGVIITDVEGRIVFMNDAAVALRGSSVAAHLGKRPPEAWDDTSEETSLLLQCIRTGHPVLNVQRVIKSRSGRVHNCVLNSYPLKVGGKVSGAAVFFREYGMVHEEFASICRNGKRNNRDVSATGARFSFSDLVGDDPAFRESMRMARMAALTPSPVMIQGETGTGKELLAQAIHNLGPRKGDPCVGLSCAAIPENLLEGILFGTTKGAFTGAVDRPGLFEKASGGTLFLDEVNSMPLGLQAKLLRVVQERRIRRLGSLQEKVIDVKILSAINEDSHVAIEAGRLRLDLFHRLGVVLIHIPPLRERHADIPRLTRFFIERYNTEFGLEVSGVSDEVARVFLDYSWPGNVRELQHVIEGAMNMLPGHGDITLASLPSHVRRAVCAKPSEIGAAQHAPGGGESGGNQRDDQARDRTVPTAGSPGERDAKVLHTLLQLQARQEVQAIVKALTEARGNVTEAARVLGVSSQRLGYRMKKHRIDRRRFLA